MIMKVYTTTDVWEIDTELTYIEETVDRIIVTIKDNPDERLIIFSCYIVAIENYNESLENKIKRYESEDISIGTSD